MTRVVLYTHDFEPITVLELDRWSLDQLEKRRNLQVLVPPSRIRWPVVLERVEVVTFKRVTITAEPLYRFGKKFGTLLFTSNEEDAMLLKSTFLPGQHKDVQSRERDAMARGFADAITRIMGGLAGGEW